MNLILISGIIDELFFYVVLSICIINFLFVPIYLRLQLIKVDKAAIALQLFNSELRYRTFFDRAPIVGLVWKEGFIITDWNQQAELILGWTKAEVLGRCGLDFLVPEFALAELKKDMCKFERTTMLAKNTSTYQSRDGQVLTFEWSNVWLTKPLRHEIEIISLGIDITERNKTDAAIALALTNVERAEAEQRHLLSVASHEFRTPAAMIKASLDSLAYLKDAISPEVTLRLENIRQASQRMISLANHLISEDRLQALTLRPQMQSVNLYDLTTKVLSRYPGDSNLLLHVPDQAVLLETDAILLSIAIHNLIDNALQNNLQQNLPVVVSLTDSDGIVEIQVADLGPGVPEQDQESVFQRFHSAKGGVSDGLGLSIVSSVARAHGGIAFVYDNLPHGAVFVIQLPGNYQGQTAF